MEVSNWLCSFIRLICLMNATVDLSLLSRNCSCIHCWYWLCQEKSRYWGIIWGWKSIISEHSCYKSWIQNSQYTTDYCNSPVALLPHLASACLLSLLLILLLHFLLHGWIFFPKSLGPFILRWYDSFFLFFFLCCYLLIQISIFYFLFVLFESQIHN